MIGPLPQHRDASGHDLFPTLHLDRGYDSAKTRDLLEIPGFDDQIAVKGVPAPIQVGRRWPVERTSPPAACADDHLPGALTRTATQVRRSGRWAASSTWGRSNGGDAGISSSATTSRPASTSRSASSSDTMPSR